jgi:hypothetical protein
MKAMDDQLYRAFLVRLWRSRTDEPWRVTLQHPANQTEQHFASMADFIRFVEETAVDQPPDTKTMEKTK